MVCLIIFAKSYVGEIGKSMKGEVGAFQGFRS
jgi:hypothetical protein